MPLTTRFDTSKPICTAQGRHGEMIVVQGDGVRPLRINGPTNATDAGMDKPSAAPTCTIDSTPNYYIARCDVVKPGAVYSSAPEVTFTPAPDETLGAPAKAKSYLSQSTVSEILVESGGKYYGSPPVVALSATHGSGASILADTGASSSTGVNEWIVAGGSENTPDIPKLQKTRYPIPNLKLAIEITGNGTFSKNILDLINLTFPERVNNYFTKRVFATDSTDFSANTASGCGSEAHLDSYIAAGWTDQVKYRVSGFTPGANKCVVVLHGDDYLGYAGCADLQFFGGVGAFRSAYGCSGIKKVEVREVGSGHNQDNIITVEILPSFNIGQAIIIEGFPTGHPLNTLSKGSSIRDVSVTNKGSGYVVTPQLEIVSQTGFGGYATCTTNSSGELDTVTLENKGGNYKTNPEVRILSGGAEAFAVSRPHFRGKYQCYYRFIDDTTEGKGGPIPSVLSDVKEVDAGEVATSITWVVPAPLGRAKKVELWRSTGNQALTVYKVSTIDATQAISVESIAVTDGGLNYTSTPTVTITGGSPTRNASATATIAGGVVTEITITDSGTGYLSPPTVTITGGGSISDATATATLTTGSTSTITYLDDVTDMELRDPDRGEYAAMPIILPNGELNSQRFVPPPSDKKVVVKFQDRYWYGVGGSNPDSVLFSEIDEPESVPKENEIIAQENTIGPDSLKAMIPLGGMLMLMQSRHAYGLTFSKQPLLDAQVSQVAYRGCINQRCFDVYGGNAYVMDQYGVYQISPSGATKNLSDAIDDQFRGELDLGRTDWNFVRIDPKTKTLRAFVVFTKDGLSQFPTRALCMNLDTNAWWVEMYPQRISSSTLSTFSNGRYGALYAGQGGTYVINEGRTDAARGSVSTVTLTNAGTGYTKPPKVVLQGGLSGEVQATIANDGTLSGLWILNPGHGYTSGSLSIAAPDRPGGVQAVGTYTATSLTQDTALAPTFRYRSGFYELPNDNSSKDGGSKQNRSIALSYEPQESVNEVSLRTYYNGSEVPRPNLVSRDRGDGFRHSVVDPAARLNIGQEEDYSPDSGVSVANYSGKSMDDIKSSDRHVAVGLNGARGNGEEVVFYKLDVYGAGE
jgi:hypothetical protein